MAKENSRRRTRREAAGSSGQDLRFRRPRQVDFPLQILTIVMLCFGLVMLFSASMSEAYADRGSTSYYLIRQSLFTVIGIVAIILLSFWPLKRLINPTLAIGLYLVVTFLLILTLTPFGVEIYGQRRWLPAGIMNLTFQPSELAKIAVIYCGAAYFTWLREQRGQDKLPWGKTAGGIIGRDFFFDFGIPLIAVTIWCLIISQQSHMSAVLILLLLTFFMLLSAGISRRSWFVAVSLGLVIVLLLTLIFLVFRKPILEAIAGNPRLDHLIQRFNIFTGSDLATADDSYQSDQALIAIGSGGWTGVGLGQGRQKANYLPEAHNDYIYSIICEELGFAGGAVVILLFLAFFLRGIYIALNTTTLTGQMLASGYSVLIALQAFLSIAVNLKVFFPTGISLPFFSYGGTSNLFFMIAVGLLLNVSKFGTTLNSREEGAGAAREERPLPSTHRQRAGGEPS